MTGPTTELCQLGLSHGTDKVVGGFTAFYHLLFSGRRDITKLLEIGIGTASTMTHVEDYRPGASLRMWADYFPAADIYALDIDASVLVNEGRIHSMQCNQRIPHQLKQVAEWGSFDIIIDDGDHTVDSQLTALKYLLPLVKPGGLYIIEDAQEQEELSNHLSDDFKLAHTVVTTHGRARGKLILIQIGRLCRPTVF